MFNRLLNTAAQLLGEGHNRNYFFDRNTTTELLGNPSPVWVDTTAQWVLYNEIGELRSVINRYSNMVASAHPLLTDKDGNPVERVPAWVEDLLNRPNALQSWASLVKFVAINKCVTENALMYAPKGSLGDTQNLTPLAFNDVQIISTGASLRQTEVEGLIKEFKIKKDALGGFDTFTPDEVVYLPGVDGVNLWDTNSRMRSLRDPLSNIALQYRKRNVLLDNLFTLGILSADNTDGISAVPIDEDDIKETREDMKRRHEGEIIITDKSFKFDPLTFPVKDLMLFEELTEDKLALIDAYGLNQFMFASGVESRGSTFNNVEMGERMAYNSTIIPDTESMYAEIGRQLGLEKEGIFLRPSFKHISVLKADATKEAEALFKRAQAVEKMLQYVDMDEKEVRDLLKLKS